MFDRLEKRQADLREPLKQTATELEGVKTAAQDTATGVDQSSEKIKTSLKKAGDDGGKALIAQLKDAVRNGTINDTDTAKVRSDIDAAFKKAGTTGAEALFQEFSRALGTGGMGSGAGQKVVSAFQQFGLKGGATAGNAFSGGFLSGLGTLAGASAPVLAPMAAALVAELLADVGGALEATAGFGGLLAGSLIQAKENSSVQDAAKSFGHWLMSQLTDQSATFAPAMISGLATLKTDLAGPLQDLGKDFASLAPYLRDFATYLGAAVEKFMPGFNRAIQSSGPILDELGHGLVYVADGLNVMFDEISKGGKGEVEGLDVLFRVLGETLAGLGFLIRGSADAFDGLVQVEKTAVDWTDRLLGSWTLVGPLLRLTGLKGELDGVSRSFDDGGAAMSGWAMAVNGAAKNAQLTTDDLNNLAGALGKTSATADTLAGEVSKKLFDSVMGIDQATLKWHESLLSLQDTLAKNGTQIDKHTDSINLNSKKGQENEAAILAMVTANMQSYQAFIAAGGSAQVAAQQYDSNTIALEKQLKQAHFTQAEIDNLIGKYRAIPDIVNTTIAVNGLKDAIDNLSYLMALINNISTGYTDKIAAINQINNNMGHLATGGLVGAASGMARGGLTWVGEQGPELVRLPYGSSVMSNPDSTAYATQATAPAAVPQFAGWIGPGANSALVAALQQLQATGQLRFTSN